VSFGALLEREMVVLLRGWRVAAYLVLVGILAFAYAFSLTAQVGSGSPMDNSIHGGVYILLLTLFCVGIFGTDIFFAKAESGTNTLNLLFPKKRTTVLLSKLLPTVFLYLLGLLVFSLFFLALPNPPAFYKLWGARLLMDTLLFFALLFLAVVVSIKAKSMTGSTLTISTLFVFLLFSPYILFHFVQVPYITYVNPIALEYEAILDLNDGGVENLAPFLVLFGFLLLFAGLMLYALRRMEAKD